MQKPKLTVITPVLNGAKTIRECLVSVKSQDYSFIEHLVIDGGSCDGTLDILKEEGVAYVSEKDAGIYDAFSKGVRVAQGDFVHILNSDDFYASDDVASKIITYMCNNDFDLCHGFIEQIDYTGKIVKRVGRAQDKNALLKKMKVAHPSVFVKKAVYDIYGTFSCGFKIAGDHEFLLRVWDKVNIGFLPMVLVKMRLGGTSNSQIILSYRESMAATILHGAIPLKAVMRYYYEIFKNNWLIPNLLRQKMGKDVSE